MTPEEFKVELEKLQLDSIDERLAIFIDPKGIYSIHVENEGWATHLVYSKTGMGQLLIQAYNLISKEPEKFRDEIVRIENLLSTRDQGGVFFCNSAKGDAEALFKTELQWARSIWGSNIHKLAFVHFEFWNTRPNRYRFALPAEPYKSPAKTKKIRNPQDDYDNACKDAKRSGNASTVVVFRGTGANNYEILKCDSMTPELWVLLVWIVMGSGSGSISPEAYSAYCCLFKPNDGSKAWFESVFAVQLRPIKWEPIDKDEVYDGLVFTRFIEVPD
jgi:hypothetical protein